MILKSDLYKKTNEILGTTVQWNEFEEILMQTGAELTYKETTRIINGVETKGMCYLYDNSTIDKYLKIIVDVMVKDGRLKTVADYMKEYKKTNDSIKNIYKHAGAKGFTYKNRLYFNKKEQKKIKNYYDNEYRPNKKDKQISIDEVKPSKEKSTDEKILEYVDRLLEERSQLQKDVMRITEENKQLRNVIEKLQSENNQLREKGNSNLLNRLKEKLGF